MNALVKKEIRLVLPAWSVAVLLAMVQGITRPYDFYVASLLFFGLTIMALSTIGRETSLNTFSSLLAQPAERLRIWQVKLSVLSVAFLVVLLVWLTAFGIAFHNSQVDESDRENSYNLFITICLIATATFTGGLWTTLLLRQIAGSFWITLLLPATLSGFSAAFSAAASGSDSLVIAVISVVIGIYSIAGFFFARRLYFRAQDVGWSGGVITLPEWKFLSRARAGEEVRTRRPVFALLKKEFLLQQGALTGAAGLLLMHVVIVLIRAFHHFQKDSAGEILSAIFWMLWLIFPVIIGSIAVAEERKLGVIENQLCLPTSRRLQFAIKTLVTLCLGVLLGGVVPIFVEAVGYAMGGSHVPAVLPYLQAAVFFSAWLVLVSFFASSLARNFLQSIGYAMLTFILFGIVTPIFTARHMLFFDSVDKGSILYAVVGVPVVMVTLLWLAWLNYKDYRSGWALLGRSVFGAVGAALFVAVATEGIYNRAWEVFEPVEPAHGLAKLSLANPPVIWPELIGNLGFQLQVQPPDGHFWYDQVISRRPNPDHISFYQQFRYQLNPLPHSAGPHQLDGSTNWVSGVVRDGPLETVGIQADGSLWVSEKSGTGSTQTRKMLQYDSETNWQQLVSFHTSILLLKKDGTLWFWGTNRFDWKQPWPGWRSFPLRQLGTNSDWCEIYSSTGFRAQRVDGSVWIVGLNQKGSIIMHRDSWFEHIARADRFNMRSWGNFAYACTDGTLSLNWGNFQPNSTNGVIRWQIGKETNWVSSAWSWGCIFALKSDGTLWTYGGGDNFMPPDRLTRSSPHRLGIHNDWVALTPVPGGAVSLAADGSLWYWPDRAGFDFNQLLLKLPKQPKYLGNIFSEAG